MNRDPLLDALVYAHALLLDPKKWSKGCGVRDKDKMHVAAKDPTATTWDMLGAVLKFSDVETMMRAKGVVTGVVKCDIGIWEQGGEPHSKMIYAFQVAILLAQGVS